jgi:hypothetical protein
MWAGVQNVSRPIVLCQEMSQKTPVAANVTAATAHQTDQGTASARVRTSGSSAAYDNAPGAFAVNVVAIQ